jgi:hypothetical protein
MCNSDHRCLVSEDVARGGFAPQAIIMDLIARNKVPAVAVAALAAERSNDVAVLAVMPSDHVVRQALRLIETPRALLLQGNLFFSGSQRANLISVMATFAKVCHSMTHASASQPIPFSKSAIERGHRPRLLLGITSTIPASSF